MRVVQMRPNVSMSEKSCCLTSSTSSIRTSRRWLRLLSCGIYLTRRKPSASISGCCPTTSVWRLTITKNLLAVHYGNAGNPSSACFQSHTAAGTCTVRCIISWQDRRQRTVRIKTKRSSLRDPSWKSSWVAVNNCPRSSEQHGDNFCTMNIQRIWQHFNHIRVFNQ